MILLAVILNIRLYNREIISDFEEVIEYLLMLDLVTIRKEVKRRLQRIV